MDAITAPRPPVAFPIETPRRIRPMVILEIAAAAIIILGLAAALSRSWFQNDPDTPTLVPAVALQGDDTPTPEVAQPEQTPTVDTGAVPTEAANAIIPTIAAEGSVPTEAANPTIPTISPDGSMEPTVEPPGGIPGTVWVLPGNGEIIDFGGLLVEDDTIYRLIATSDFVGIQAIDSRTGVAKWQQAQQWAGDFFAIEDDTLYFGGGDNTLVAVDAKTGERRRTMDIPGNPIAMTEDDDRVFVLLDSDIVVALDEETGEQLWVAQGTVPQNPTGGSTSFPAISKITVENGVVVAISSYGVLSGFDVQTGEELWAHEGYDSASTTVESEDDHIVVSSGMGLMTVSVRVGSQDEAQITAANDQCAQYFESSTETDTTAAGALGTPEADASTYHLPGSTFRAQAIDPRTGNILWEQQLISGAAAATVVAANSGNSAMCLVDAETGQISADYTGSSITMIGNIPGQVQELDGEDGGTILVGKVGDPEEFPVAVAVEDGFAYLQLTDGTLVKVSVSHPYDNDDHHEDDHSDDDDDSHDSDDD